MARLWSLTDWPLIAKFAIGPALALILVLGMALVEVTALNSVRDDTHNIVAIDMRESARLADIAARFQSADADLNRLTNMEAANPRHVNVSEHAAAILRTLHDVSRDLADFRQTELGHANRPRIDAALTDIDEYTQASIVVMSMVDIDFDNAVGMLGRFHDFARQVTESMHEIGQRGIAESGRRAELISMHVADTVRVFIVLVLVVVPGIGIESLLIGLATVRSIRKIADATTQLAAADYDVDIASLARKDELGAVVAALQTFRGHALEARRLQALESESRDLKIAKTAAESANKAKSAFLANMSHELRTPLNAILGYAQLLTRDAGMNPQQGSAARTIHKSGAHLLTLITDILDLSKIEAGKLELYPAVIDLRSFLHGVADIIAVRAQEEALTFIFAMSDDLPHYVTADEKRLRQVLLNLLGNAVKFTDQGEISLRVRLVEMKDAVARIRLEVCDRGVGISADQLEAIFQPFEQVGDVQRRSSGTGLGLSISCKLVELMGSKINVESALGRGSRFSFEIDLAVSTVERVPLPMVSSVAGYRGERRSILVVDDVQENRDMLAEMLGQVGFQVIQAADGFEALRQAEAERPDLILMDVRMPVMDGLQSTQGIRAIPALRTIPIIAVSAGVAPEEQARSLAAGANGFLTKPINHDDLIHIIASHLPLEWIEEASGKPMQFDTDAALGVAPPLEAMEQLHGLALAGNMRELRACAERLSALDVRYQPFVSKLQQLAGAYQSQAVLSLIEHHLDRKQVAS